MMVEKKGFIFIAILVSVMCLMCMYNGNQYHLLTEKLNIAQNELTNETNRSDELLKRLAETSAMVSELKSNEYELIYIGDYKISHYCVERYAHICGEGAGVTSTGTIVTPGRTIAVDSSYIPYGSSVYIEGYGWRIAEDCGGGISGKHIDMAVNSHEEAMRLGINKTGVWLLLQK